MRKLFTGVTIETISTFAQLSPEIQHALKTTAVLYHLKPEEYLFRQGESAHAIYAIQQGGVRLVEHTGRGKSVTIKVYSSGDIFGLLAISGPFHHPASLITLEESWILAFDGAQMRQVMLEYPAAALLFIDLLVEHVHHAHERIRHLATEDTEQRLARALLHMHQKFGSLRLTQQDFAEFTGATLETVNRILRQWEIQGILKRARRHVELLQPDALQRIATPA